MVVIRTRRKHTQTNLKGQEIEYRRGHGVLRHFGRFGDLSVPESELIFFAQLSGATRKGQDKIFDGRFIM